jgi:hypothetical protein
MGVLGSFISRHQLPPGAVELVTTVTWCDVHMIVPHVLIAGRFVVLAGGYPVAAIRRFQRQGDHPGDAVNVAGIGHRQVIDVFEMLVGDDDDVAVVVRPLGEPIKAVTRSSW